MKEEERNGMCELLNCTSGILVEIIHKDTFDTSDVQNIKQMILDSHFANPLLANFQPYMNLHIYKISDDSNRTAILLIITRGLDDKIQELLAARKEDAVMQASRTAERKTKCSKGNCKIPS